MGHAGVEAISGSHPMTTVQSGHYRHHKGNEYTLIGVVCRSEIQEEFVVYRQKYGEHGLWLRPTQMFLEAVSEDSKDVPRFRFLGPNDEDKPTSG